MTAYQQNAQRKADRRARIARKLDDRRIVRTGKS